MSRDALQSKFAEDSKSKGTSSPGQRQYTLRRVFIDRVSTPKRFHARLEGVHVVDNINNNINIDDNINNNKQVEEGGPGLGPGGLWRTKDTALVAGERELRPSSSETPPLLAAPPKSQSSEQYRDAAMIQTKEVDVTTAFEAIALAIRHNAVVEVKSSLLQSEKFSYSFDELSTCFPKLVESDVSMEVIHTLSHQHPIASTHHII